MIYNLSNIVYGLIRALVITSVEKLETQENRNWQKNKNIATATLSQQKRAELDILVWNEGTSNLEYTQKKDSAHLLFKSHT